MKKTILFWLLIFYQLLGLSQTTYFDKYGNATDKNTAYYQRESKGDNYYKSYYSSDKTLYFEGIILNANNQTEENNTYSGVCSWYHKRGIKKAIISFDDNGIKNGTSTYFYEDGKIWKEIEYIDDRIRYNTFFEYDQFGVKFLVFEDFFQNNYNDWELFTSAQSASTIKWDRLFLESFLNEGTSRYIPITFSATDYVLETEINISENKKGLSGIVYGFKDWDNYHYFMIGADSKYYIGYVYEGIHSSKADGLITSSINPKHNNIIKIINGGGKTVFSINGTVINSAKSVQNFGNKFGVCIKGKGKISVNKLILKAVTEQNSNTNFSEVEVKATGTGVVFSKEGYIITNHHVVDGAKQIIVDIYVGGVLKSLNAELVVTDKENDIAVIKITESFSDIESVDYSFKEDGTLDVGEMVFTIGYPLALSGMGKDPKFTDGKVSSKRGYDGAINSFQTTIPVQPGNSGGPVYNEKGQLIGLINAKVANADNVSYAIKLNYIKSLIDLTPMSVELPSSNDLSSKSLEDKIKVLTRYSVLIKIK